ncbi:hypothetical protein [Ferruginibacter profundus]
MNNNYTTTKDKLIIDDLIQAFYNVFNNLNQRQVDCDTLYMLCIPETIIIKKSSEEEIVYNLASFIKPRQTILTDGTLIEFEEFETEEDTMIIGNIARRYSKYKKRGCLNGAYFEGSGNKLFQFINTKNSWRISSVIWEDAES